MKYLITGCSGFVGYHVAQNLINKNNFVIGLQNNLKNLDEKKNKHTKNICFNKSI